jgi:hypothetical protein
MSSSAHVVTIDNCAVSHEEVHGPFFFTEATLTVDSFMEMKEHWLLPQLNTNYDDYSLQLDGVPFPHFHTNVRVLLNRVLLQRWIGRATNGDHSLLPWPSRSPVLIPCDFFPWGFVKDSVYVPPLPRPSRNLVIG